MVCISIINKISDIFNIDCSLICIRWIPKVNIVGPYVGPYGMQISVITPFFRETVQIREFATAITQNISDLEIKVTQNAIFSKIRKFDDSQINLMEFIFIFF